MRRLIPYLLLLASAPSTLAADLANSPRQRAAFEAYRTCATLGLPRPHTIRDPEQAATLAAAGCKREYLAIAGQYALDNPGTRATGTYLESRRTQLIHDLAAWIRDMQALNVDYPR